MFRWFDYVTSFSKNSHRFSNPVKCFENMQDNSWECLYKVHYVSPSATPTIHQNHNKLFYKFTKQKIFYQ